MLVRQRNLKHHELRKRAGRLPNCRWSYLGLGEPLCFVAFGPLATTAFYLAQARLSFLCEGVSRCGQLFGCCVRVCCQPCARLLAAASLADQPLHRRSGHHKRT